MNIKNRNLHMLYFSSMIVLTITGFMVYMPHSWVELLGNYPQAVFEYRSLLHRLAALVFIFTACQHLYYIIKTKEGRWQFEHLLPKWSDLAGPLYHFREITGLRKKTTPTPFFNYEERLEYWLTFSGTVVVILTGVILWLEDYFGNLELDVSLLLHFYASLLALLGMIVWNITNLHPEFYFYRKEEELPCCREECVQCDACLENKEKQPSAWTYCLGDNHERAVNFLKRGVTTCEEAARLINDGTCPHSCLELGTCAHVCMYGARTVDAEGLLELIDENCVGCGMCVRECPTQVIKLRSRLFYVHIACNSQFPKYTASLNCNTQCRRCLNCLRSCNRNAISFNGHLPEIDYQKCISCGICVTKCPAEVITDGIDDERAPAEIMDKCIGCGNCLRVCPVDAIFGNPKEVHLVDRKKCISCGLCARNCKQNAIRVAWLDKLKELQAASFYE